MTMWRMRFVSWIPGAKNTLSEYVIFNCFFTATMVARTRVIVTLCVHCQSSLMLNLVAHILTAML